MKICTNPVKRVEPLTQERSASEDKDLFIAQEVHLDTMMGKLFAALSRTFGREFSPGGDLTHARVVVSGWEPQLHALGLDDVRQAGKQYVLSNFFKRWLTTDENGSDNTDRLSNEAALKFIETNDDGFDVDLAYLSSDAFKDLIPRMRSIITSRVGELFIPDVYAHCKHGPNGTTSISRDNAYLHIKKGDITGTRYSLQQFWHYLRGYDTPLREQLVEMNDRIREFVNSPNIDAADVSESTSMLFVRKSWKAFRSMCPEMTIPAFFAQGVAYLLTRILYKSFNIDLSTQSDVHRNMTRLASKFPEIGLATIDWSEASDRIWMALVEALFPTSWYRFMLYVCRSNSTIVTLKASPYHKRGYVESDMFKLVTKLNASHKVFVVDKKKGEILVTLKTTMFCTMGNPLTFPLQTMIFHTFLTVCTQLAAERKAKDPTFAITPRDVPSPSSFGDDGLVWVHAEEEIRHYAKLLKWKLNADKSYFSGGFRESCGVDYLHGENIRPVMLQRPATDFLKYSLKGNEKIRQAWSYAAANAVLELVTRFGYDTYHIDKWLEETHASSSYGRICVVPPYYPEGSGLRLNWDFDWTSRCYSYRGKVFLQPEVDNCVALDPMVYHKPRFNSTTHSYDFWGLKNVPGCYELDSDSEFMYYHEASRRTGTDSCEDKFVKSNFFGLDTDRTSALDNEGNTRDRKLVIKKQIQSVLSWTYWI